jgi:hypothetical protein
MKIQDITEGYVNLFNNDKEKRERYAARVFELIRSSYARIGGMKGSGFNNPQDMIDRIPFWKLFMRGDEIKAVAMYKDKNGRKRVAVATDGTSEGKQIVARIMQDDATSGRAYAEISGPSLAFHKKILGDNILNDISIPVESVIKILKADSEDIRAINDYEYERNINGNWIEKRMIGRPGNAIKDNR